eukprot:m.14162 g.14162  ORF g.14162 m.14162 type:complete len:281 (+) comp4268_c0_seq1:77-919(+)
MALKNGHLKTCKRNPSILNQASEMETGQPAWSIEDTDEEIIARLLQASSNSTSPSISLSTSKKKHADESASFRSMEFELWGNLPLELVTNATITKDNRTRFAEAEKRRKHGVETSRMPFPDLGKSPHVHIAHCIRGNETWNVTNDNPLSKSWYPGITLGSSCIESSSTPSRTGNLWCNNLANSRRNKTTSRGKGNMAVPLMEMSNIEKHLLELENQAELSSATHQLKTSLEALRLREKTLHKKLKSCGSIPKFIAFLEQTNHRIPQFCNIPSTSQSNPTK